MKQRPSVRNATHATMAWAASPVGRLARIEVLVTLSCALLAVVVFVGSHCRASTSGFFRFVIWLALMLSYPAVSYTFGLMQSACFRNKLIVVWGCFLFLLIGCADGIAAYRLDFDQKARTMLNQALQVVYVFFLLLSYANLLPEKLTVLLFLLWALSVAKLVMRFRSFLLSGRDRVLTDYKLIADYMLREYEFCGADYDAVAMRGYKYFVSGEGKQERRGEHGIQRTNDLVTVDRVWRCEGPLLSSGDSAPSRRRDLCLSFALFKLLRRRFGGYLLHEARHNKTRDFVWKGLVGAGAAADSHSLAEKDHDHERMFRVVEVELGFLFDFFYARHPSPKETLLPDTFLFAAVFVRGLYTLFPLALLGYHSPSPPPNHGSITAAIDASCPPRDFATTSFDIWLTRIVIILFVILESFQYLTLVVSDWNKVKLLCRYVLEPSWHGHPVLEPLLRLMFRVRLPFRSSYWNSSVGQYSLLYACFQVDNSPILRLPLPYWVRGFIVRMKTTDQQKLPDTVKVHLHRCLRRGLGRLRHGETALEQNQTMDAFSWAISQRSTVHTIMVWHVATTTCDLQFGTTTSDSGVIESHQVATVVSDYCAYLVSSAPELLPGHSNDTKLLFEAVQRVVMSPELVSYRR